MTTIIPSFQTVASALGSLRSTSGWIGVDIGTSAVKLAQVERLGDSWRLRARWTIDQLTDSPVTCDQIAAGELAKHSDTLRQTRRMFRGRRACATLPNSHVDLRALDLPSGPWHETRAILDQELSADSLPEAGPYEYDAWQAMPGEAMTKIMAVSARSDATLRVASDLLAAGLTCSIIDAVPCAIARAVSLCDPASSSETVAAIDFGYSTNLLTVVHQGRPVFCRVLRGCALRHLMQPLIDKLGISIQECRQLLLRFGIPSEVAGAPAARATYQVMSHALQHLADELRRTLEYASNQLRLSPKRIWLFGGGATIRNAPDFVSRETHVPAAAWRLSRGDSAATSSEPLYGVAAGLSLLAWEDGKCT